MRMNTILSRFCFFVGLMSALALGAIGKPLNTSLFGSLAVDGYDVVAYFTDPKPRPGKKISPSSTRARFIVSRAPNIKTSFAPIRLNISRPTAASALGPYRKTTQPISTQTRGASSMAAST
jgi:hypothetical protein